MASDSSDDDVPLARSNGHRSSGGIPKSADRAMDESNAKNGTSGGAVPIRNGPVEDGMDIDSPAVNGSPKRKQRGSINKTVNYKDDSDSDGAPLAKRQKARHQKDDSDSDDQPISKSRAPKLPPSAAAAESSDDDQPLNKKLSAKKAAAEKTAAKDAKAKKSAPRKSVADESDDDAPLAKGSEKRQSNGVTPSKGSAKKPNGVKRKHDSDSDEPIAKKSTTTKPAKNGTKPAPKSKAKEETPAKKAAAKAKEESPAKKGAKGKREETEEASEEEEEYQWWNEPKKEDDSIKWTTLEHNGVIFPPPYEPLPSHVKLVYDGIPVTLHPEAEEVAGFFGAMLNSTHNVENPVFQRNFFGDFKEILNKTGGAKDKDGNPVDIKEFAKLDFKAIFDYYQAKSEARKALPPAEKKALKEAKEKLEAPYLYCKWNGRKEKVGNFRVEPPGLFRGRGEHPKTGKLKKRVMPEQVTINIGKEAKVPDPPPGHKWKAVQHDNKATWLAMWQENINGAYKYVMLAANSSIKGQSDFKKFEKARELKKHIDKIRRDYTKDLKSDSMADRQRATAVYLIDKLALRAGNEKDTENEAETVGCCSLKYEHVTLREPNIVIFDFLGKDSIRYYDEVEVDRQVFKNLKMFKRPPKENGDDIFDRLTTTQLNKHLSSYMPGLTAKVFRTYNASHTMQVLLRKLEVDKHKTIAEKVNVYNAANREVAILCNHKRTVGASHEAQMEKLGDRIKGLKYQKWRLKMMLLDVDPKLKKKKGPEYFELDGDLTEEWVLEHQAFLIEEQKTKIEKKFQKENEKRAADGERPLPEKELKERLKALKDMEAKFKKENKTKKVEAEGKNPSVERLEAQIQKMEERIRTLELQAEDKDGNKEVALGTSKINYIDPRLTVVFAKKFDVPIEKFFSKTLREKFNWAIKSIDDDADWEF